MVVVNARAPQHVHMQTSAVHESMLAKPEGLNEQRKDI